MILQLTDACLHLLRYVLFLECHSKRLAAKNVSEITRFRAKWDVKSTCDKNGN